MVLHLPRGLGACFLPIDCFACRALKTAILYEKEMQIKNDVSYNTIYTACCIYNVLAENTSITFCPKRKLGLRLYRIHKSHCSGFKYRWMMTTFIVAKWPVYPGSYGLQFTGNSEIR